MQVTTKDAKKADRVCMKSPLPEAECAKIFFQPQPHIFGVNFSNNMSRLGSIWLKMSITQDLKPLNYLYQV